MDTKELMTKQSRVREAMDWMTSPPPGDSPEPVTEGDILESSEAFRAVEDYFAHPKNNREMMERLAAENPQLLACMHGSSWRGDGAALLRKYADVLDG